MTHCFAKLNWLPRAVVSDVYFTRIASPSARVPHRFISEGGGGGGGGGDVSEPPLVDGHGRRHDYLRVSLTERCNLRCQYCMPAEGVQLCARGQLLSAAETVRAVAALARAGVSKVRLTGGEPTLRADLPAVARALAALPGVATLAMTSNGVALARPGRLAALRAAGLARLNLSLDSLRADRYALLARRAALPRVLAAVDVALDLGFAPLKINTVLIKGFNDDEILDFVKLTEDRDIEVRFIEFMPFSGNEWSSSRLVPTAHVRDTIAAAHGAMRREPAAHGDTARVWRVPGHRGAVGFVSSMTEHFCAGCSRLRLTADGSLKVCLFGAAEVSLRDAMRAGASDGDLLALVRAALARKAPRHAGMEDLARMDNRPMILIGG